MLVHTIFRAATFNYLATISTRSCFRVESSLHLSRWLNGGVYGQSSTITLILHTTTEYLLCVSLCVSRKSFQKDERKILLILAQRYNWICSIVIVNAKYCSLNLDLFHIRNISVFFSLFLFQFDSIIPIFVLVALHFKFTDNLITRYEDCFN